MTETPTLSGYLRIIRRRKWMVVQVLLLGPLVALVLSLHQTPQYQASAGVLLNLEPTVVLPEGTAPAAPTLTEDPARVVQNRARLATSEPVARSVIANAGVPGETPSDLLSRVDVRTTPGEDVLTFSVRDHDAGAAVRLANAYSRRYVTYLDDLQTRSIARARAELQRRIDALRASGDLGTRLTNLTTAAQRLDTAGLVPASTASLLRPATSAAKIKPRVLRNVVLSLVVSALVAFAAALVLEALDSRVRSEEEIGELLGLPLLARLRETPRRLRARGGLTMLDAPESAEAEAFRILRLALETATRQQQARSIMFTSAVDGEGRSTTAANLAIAYARAGRRVVLADFDLRYPSLDRLFDLEGRPGAADVLVGHVPLDEALADIDVPARTLALAPRGDGRGATLANGNGGFGGRLQVLTAGPVSADARELLLSPAVTELIAQLGEDADVVLVDAPPIVPVGDAQALATRVDATLVVVRLAFVRRRLLKELRRRLEMTPAPALGYVLLEPDREENGAITGFYRQRQPRRRQIAGAA